MGDDALESERDRVMAELAAARTEYASLGARSPACRPGTQR